MSGPVIDRILCGLILLSALIVVHGHHQAVIFARRWLRNAIRGMGRPLVPLFADRGSFPFDPVSDYR
jgi:hypothetical protein